MTEAGSGRRAWSCLLAALLVTALAPVAGCGSSGSSAPGSGSGGGGGQDGTTSCGGSGAPCCNGIPCDAEMTCNSGVCSDSGLPDAAHRADASGEHAADAADERAADAADERAADASVADATLDMPDVGGDGPGDVGTCASGQTQCQGSSVQTCDSTGNWGIAMSCATGTCSGGQCTGSCTPGTTQCSGNGVQTCGSSATWGTAAACTNKTCVSGVLFRLVRSRPDRM